MYCRGNPVKLVDREGTSSNSVTPECRFGHPIATIYAEMGENSSNISGTPDISNTPNVKSLVSSYAKKAFEHTIKSTAERAFKLYTVAENFVNQAPQLIGYVNHLVLTARQAVEAKTNMDPNTMGWLDLTKIWLFELGDLIITDHTIHFGPDAETTRDLQVQEGVSTAREMALGRIESGDNTNVNYSWVYGTKELYESNPATLFLGSYNTNVSIERAGDSSYTLTFTVENTSGWGSATRLRANRNYIIPDKERGDGIKLGGNLKQKWTWTETINSQ
jgi:hypothetical protein